MALKSIDDVDGNGFDDELSSTKIAYLAKNFRNFLRNNNRKARGKNNAKPRNFKRNEPTKVNNTDKSKEQTNRSASSKLEHMLSIQKSPLDKTGLGFEDSSSVPNI